LRQLGSRLRRSVFAALIGTFVALPALADEVSALREAMAAVTAKDWPRAQALAPTGVGADIVEWHRLRNGDGLLGDYEAFQARNPDWPGMPYVHQQGETAVVRSSTPARVIDYFAKDAPSTPEGAVALVQALGQAGRSADAAAAAQRAWLTLRLDAESEAALLSSQGTALAAVHEKRLDWLLWDGRIVEARRMLSRVSPGWRILGEARIALRADEAGVNALIDRVPAALSGDAGMAYERFLWRLRKGYRDSAIDLLLERSASADLLGDPEKWADRRIRLVRDLEDDGKLDLAYRVAASHHLQSGGDYAELEFLAGFIALRKLNKPAAALTHFQHLKTGVSTPISLSRADYWEGRAQEALGNATAAAAAFKAGAVHQTAYYGLLSAEKLGLSLDPALLSEARPADWRSAGFARSSVLSAARLLVAAGERSLAKRFFLHLGESLNAVELDQLADLALTLNEPHIAVLIGKQAAGQGIILPRAYFPVVPMVPDGLAVSRALALSIARRESEFDPVVISPAGARGLMQVMPGTAKLMATKTGQSYELSALTQKPAYNVSLGAAYLAQLVEEFGPAVALIASGYNAGPGRPRRWIEQYGDPRLASVDVVDWVETIPFGETRTYVMRVVESLVIYRAKLRGSVGPVNVISELTGR
jgi:soluble lytic murein transglycosylase